MTPRRPETITEIHELGTDRAAIPGSALPIEFSTIARHATLHVVSLDFERANPAALNMHIGAAREATWVATTNDLLSGRSKSAFEDLPMDHAVLPSLQPERDKFIEENARLSHLALKGRKARNVDVATKQIFTMLVRNGGADHYYVDVDPQSTASDHIADARKLLAPDKFFGLSYEEATDKIQEVTQTYAVRITEQDIEIADKLANIIAERHDDKAVRTENHGLLFLPVVNSGVYYLLTKAGLSTQHITPYADISTEQRRHTIASHNGSLDGTEDEPVLFEDFERRFREYYHRVALQDVQPDPVQRLVLMQRFNADPQEQHVAEALIGLMTSGLIATLQKMHPEVPSNKVIELFTDVCAEFESSEIARLFQNASKAPKNKQRGVFEKAFKVKFGTQRAINIP